MPVGFHVSGTDRHFLFSVKGSKLDRSVAEYGFGCIVFFQHHQIRALSFLDRPEAFFLSDDPRRCDRGAADGLGFIDPE